tara:strand:+ start:51 stop:863 length:813 start_codon:yes stop_codon:yes gene_type:complete
MKKLRKKQVYRNLNKYHHSKTQSGFLYLLERIIRSHPLLYYFLRTLVRFTNIFEEDFNGIKLIKFRNNINIMDVGASDGIASKFFYKNLNTNNIICFEPDINYVQILKKLNLKGIAIKPYAIGDKNSFKNIYFPSYRFFNKKLNLITYTHYDKDFLEQQIKLDFKFQKNITIVQKKIFIKKIVKLKKRIDLIKIDTNGFELQVLKGLIKVVAKNKPAIVLETNQDIRKIEKILRNLSYKSYYFSSAKNELKKIKKKYPLNTFFLQKKHFY